MHAYEWELIENNELWKCQPGDVNDILPSLLLSYNHLNHVYVKKCFAYYAIFPKDSEMEKYQLITLWLAQGFLHDECATNNSTLTSEMVGEKYFNILLNNFFSEEEKNDSDDGRIRYKMHDLVHDLAAYVLEKEFLVWNAGIKLADVSHVRHLAFDLANYESLPEAFTLTTGLGTRKLRTMHFCNNVPRWNNSTLGYTRYMRTLIMADTRLIEVPLIIGQLVHLRYLDLSHNPLDVLSESICKLYQLQTLRIAGCSYLRVLPGELHRLGSLRHIDTDNFFLASRRLRQLTNFQSLPGLELRDGEGWTIDELGPLDQVKGQMKIRGLQHVKNKEAARQAGLVRKDKIVTLHLEWDIYRQATSQNDEDVLDSLEPHPNLQSLYVNGFMGEGFPSWMMAMVVNNGSHLTPLMNLTEVKLRSCRKCLHLPSLGQLPLLQILSLQEFDDLECIEEAFYHVIGTANENVSFRSLSKLCIISFGMLTTWMVPSPTHTTTVFPNLEYLEIQECRKLERVPCLQFQSLKHVKLENVGGTQTLDIIKYSPGLTSLKVKGMEKMMVLPQELSNCTNLEELKIINCKKLECIPSGLTSLKELDIQRCPSLACIPDGLSCLLKLIVVDCEGLEMIGECEKVKYIPSGLICLKELRIWNCRSLACIPDGLSSLRDLTVCNCEGLEKIPKSLEECLSLEVMGIDKCPLIKGPIPDLGRLQGLKYLYMVNSGELVTSCLQWIPNLDRLGELTIGGYIRDEWDFNLTFPESLRELTLTDFPNVESLPQQLLPSSLRSLTLREFPNVKFLPQQFLPSYLQYLKIDSFDELEQVTDLGNLSSLQTLRLFSCKKLKYLPSKQVMLCLSELQKLHIKNCPLLEERCAKDAGPEWHKISHIPNFRISYSI